jgi:uncharacterized protein
MNMKNCAILLAMLFAAAAMTSIGASAGVLELSGIGAARFNVPVTSMKEARFKTTLRQQYDFSCGSAAVATLLSHHYGFPITERDVFEQMFARGDQKKIRREGFSLLDIKLFLQARGFTADGFMLPLQKLVDAGRPAIVLVQDKGYHHFVVVKGMRDGRILIGDPSSGTRVVGQAAFESMWVTKLLFVIHAGPGLARFNDGADWRAAPVAALGQGIGRESLSSVTLPKHGHGEF